MDAASANASPASKVIVQCIDPSNLFDVVTPLLHLRLPLSNLHWKSATRPLRSIDSLDVSFIREEPSAPKNTTRHQIPGLRQTPYLKVYLLRCDDKEKYKEVVRKELKEWVKNLAVSTSGKSTIKGQERHDAFEYLILHIVLPGTPAAAQPKSSKHISLEASESTDSVNSTSKSKWTGKSSSTIYDKLRADFHSSSKAPFERVAQVRILDSTKPSTALNPLELEEQWQDTLEKLKVAILQSFDTRVTQYEEDIREREAQRNLPGWNFCTFFILKEGLARGFENVGLLEDALKIYEELDAELDVVIKEQAKNNYTDAANALLPYATDLKDTIRRVLEDDSADEDGIGEDLGLTVQAWTVAELKQSPWRLERRAYQQMILTNQISALDFRIYIFIRQMQIMLRRANVPVSTPKLKATQRTITPRWDANILSGVCERSIGFLGLAVRNLKQDLFAAWGGQEGLPDSERLIQTVVMDNIVASWEWSSILQTLSECQIVTALDDLAPENGSGVQDGEAFNAHDIAESWKGRDRNHSTTTSTSSESGTFVNGTRLTSHKDIFSTIHVVQGSKEVFIFQVAELFLMLRTILVQLAQQQGLLQFLRSDDTRVHRPADTASSNSRGILSPSLRRILISEKSTQVSYKLLTVCACQCYATAGRFRTSRQLCYDLANLEAYHGQYGVAMTWLDSFTSFSDALTRTPMDYCIFELYVTCLRRSMRFEELARTLFLSLQSFPQIRCDEEKFRQIWKEMIQAAEKYGGIDFSFGSIFAVDKIENFITHVSPAGDFGVSLSLRVLVPLDHLGQGAITLELRGRNQNMPENIRLKYEGELLVRRGIVNAFLTSFVVTEGWYEVVSLDLLLGDAHFKHCPASATHTVNDEESSLSKSSRFDLLYVYPGSECPHLTISDSPARDLSLRRSVSVGIFWNSTHNLIARARLRLKPATAGLRLDLQSLTHNEHEKYEIAHLEDTQVIEFTSFSQSKTLLEIPYVLETNATLSIAIRAELSYRTTEGDFQMHETLSTSCILPISVNVQDAFQASATFSQFTFAPSRPIPIRIEDCSLMGRQNTQVISRCPKPILIDAFARQPASWIVQIVNENAGFVSHIVNGDEREQLELTVSYKCIDEGILQTMRDAFATSIIGTTFAYAMRPLLAHLLSKLQSIWTEHEIELITLNGDIEMWTFEELDWALLLHAFDKKSRSKLALWLREWHQSHQIIPLHMEAAPQRSLKLLVDVPQPLILVTTSINPNQEPSQPIQSVAQCMISQPLLIDLRVLCQYSPQSIKKKVEVSIELVSQQDLWLIGGTRKVVFDLRQEVFEFDAILVPQKTGSLLLPSIDVKCRWRDENAAIAIEVEHLSCATTVEVREGILSTILGVGDGESAEGYWIVNSRENSDTHTAIG